jgi:hypothetical protein
MRFKRYEIQPKKEAGKMAKKANLKASLVILVFLAGAAGAGWPELDKITAPDGAAGDYFGGTVSVSGNYVIVGADFDDDKGTNSGSAYIFKKSDTPGDPNWYEQVKLLASDGADNDKFGISVSVSGDYAVVGAYFDDDKGTNSGSAYIFKRSDTPGDPNWYEQVKLTASDGDANDGFGGSVSVSGDYAVVGAYWDDEKGLASGSAYIFKKSNTPADPNWYEQVKLTASDGDANNWFGYSVSVNGDYAVTGAHWDDDRGPASGSAYIFKRSDTPGDPNWYEQVKLTASDGDANDQFGRCVSVSGDYAIVGAWGDDEKGTSSGSAYVFEKSDTPGDPNWYEQDKITASDGAEYANFGWTVSVSGDYAIAGAIGDDDKGASYIFKKSDTPGDPNWYEQDKLTASDGAGGDGFGWSVSVSGDFVIVGAIFDDDKGGGSGSAYIFALDGDDDGYADDIDNCPNDVNPWQSDVDVDGAGDICDDCPADFNDECDPCGSGAWEIDSNSGGTMVTPDGNMIIDIDPCDLFEDTTISVTKIIPQDPDVDLMIGPSHGRGAALAAYDLEPDELDFNSPVTVTIRVTGLTKKQCDRAGLYIWDVNHFVAIGDSNDCNCVGDPCEVYTVTCTVELEHFSTIAMIRQVMTFYVDAAAVGANDGSSWTDAYNYLQDALGDVNLAPDDEIRVAEGTYYPDANTSDPNSSGDRAATFKLINGVAIKGGYAGFGATEPDARDIAAYVTILSGNINLPGDMNDNSYHVVTASGVDETAVLDGFTITLGYAGPFPDAYRGGGMRSSGNPTVANCIFTDNKAVSYGGGMYNSAGSPDITGCQFIANTANTGAGMYNTASSYPTIFDCAFSGNSATVGGGMYNTAASPILTDCTFTDNSADGSGGGVYNYDHSSPTFINCSFVSNEAQYGGGMRNQYYSDPNLINCSFFGNSAPSGSGGGINNYDNSSPRLVNCLFSGNTAYGDGGGIGNWTNCGPELINCTFGANRTSSNGGGIYNYDITSASTISNCILWGNTDSGGMDESAQIHKQDPNSMLVVNYCCIQGWTGALGGTGNINTDPLFKDPNGLDGTAGTEDDNLRLSLDSPCIDEGNTVAVPVDTYDLDGDGNEVELIPFDLDSRLRFADGDCNTTEIVDMGAYEFSWRYKGDFAGDCDVDFEDFDVLALTWLLEDGDVGYNVLCDISAIADYIIDEYDLKIFAN